MIRFVETNKTTFWKIEKNKLAKGLTLYTARSFEIGLNF